MLQRLPPVTKSELMANFNEWVTDPEITIESVKDFVSNLSLVGQLYLGTLCGYDHFRVNWSTWDFYSK